MQEYIATVKKLDPSWTPETPEKRGKECKTAFGGPVVSSLYQEETIREEDKNIFDYCRENNIDHVTKAIRSNNVDVNVADEEGRALLHWACDRGHKELVSVLLQHAADVNSQVSGFALQISTLLIMCSCLILSSSLDRIKAEFPRVVQYSLNFVSFKSCFFRSACCYHSGLWDGTCISAVQVEGGCSEA
ncbi:acyl-CoA-binding domain-containing protein 6 isoform X2 [Apteryx rowi]|uniref:acyl-CoA-binding domain-containing protein 6 isoform X2 n=1 Tax=Apteryx rowi TaxID=308060 RepID=UPI000E1D73FC|nr:acyl-CoA-binding domain-containing protein 6 isoform X2 [Apteryx rowi]